jgi:hypothetical protein
MQRHRLGLWAAVLASLLAAGGLLFRRSDHHPIQSPSAATRVVRPSRAVRAVPPLTVPATAPRAAPSPRVPESAIAALRSGGVSRIEVEQIYAFLEAAGVPLDMTPMMLFALKNDLLNLLRDLPQPPEDLTQELIRLHRDAAQDSVIRIYALQHLALWYDQITRTPLPGENPVRWARRSDEALEIRRVLWAALGEKRDGMAGTALLAHADLLPEHPELDATAVGRVAFELARDKQGDPFTRTSAIQICGRMGMGRALPVAVRLALQAPTIPLQTAAIAALGDLGGENERRLLLNLSEEGSPRLRTACESAMKRLNWRLSRGEEG